MRADEHGKTLKQRI